QALDAARRAVEQALPVQLPEPGNYDGMNAAGREALDDGRATVLAMLNRAYELLPAADKVALGQLKEQASDAMPDRSEETHADTVRLALRAAPQAPAAFAAPAGVSLAAAAAVALLTANMAADPQRQPWFGLATVVVGLRQLLASHSASAAPADTTGNGAAPS